MLGQRAAAAGERDDLFEAELRGLLLHHLRDVARRLGDRAELRSVDDDLSADESGSVHGDIAGRWSLIPTDDRAAEIQWHAVESDAYSTHLKLGRYTDVEILTVPKKQQPAEAAAEVREVVEAVVAGRFLEEAWYRRGSGDLVNSLGRIRGRADDRWHRIGEISRPLPILRERRFAHQTWEYAPYGGSTRAVR